MLPVAGALGVDTTFHMEGRLPQHPLSPLWEEMERMGCTLTRPTANTIRCQGKLRSGKYTIDGSISSQFITGLMFALSLIDGPAELEIFGNIESKPYIAMTQNTMARFQAPNYHTPGCMTIEGDWSNGAFFVAAAHLGSELIISGLDSESIQGDRAIIDILQQMKVCEPSIDASDIPDLVPILAVAASAGNGAVFTNIRRLRLKESDRVASVIAMINALGGSAIADDNTLTVHGTGLTGGTVDTCNDHRIAMAAAIAATICTEPVTILGANAVTKSYPNFWDEYKKLGGNYEQHIR
jgi:3-phosphoshikimate 1-carboxyvinyltransferase